MIRLTSVLGLWFQCVCPLMPSCNTYRLPWVSLTLGMVSFHGCSSKAQSLLLTLDEGYLLTAAPPDLERGIAPLSPPEPAQPPLFGHGVGPPGSCPWPREWGSSFWPPPLTLDVGYLFTAALSKCSQCSLSWRRDISSPQPLPTLNVE